MALRVLRGVRSGEHLASAAAHYCVVLNTLRGGVPVESTFELKAL